MRRGARDLCTPTLVVFITVVKMMALHTIARLVEMQTHAYTALNTLCYILRKLCFDPGHVKEHFSLSRTSRLAQGPTERLLFGGYGGFNWRGREVYHSYHPGSTLKMTGIVLLPHFTPACRAEVLMNIYLTFILWCILQRRLIAALLVYCCTVVAYLQERFSVHHEKNNFPKLSVGVIKGSNAKRGVKIRCYVMSCPGLLDTLC